MRRKGRVSDFTTKGIKETQKALRDLENKVRNKIVRTGLRSGAKPLASETKHLAPVGETGDLQKGIKVRSAKRKRNSQGMVIRLNSEDVHYGGHQEFGTHNLDGTWRIEPRGFQRQAYETKGETAKDIALKTYRDEIEKAARRK